MTSSRYRLVGTTDDVVECGRCGRVDLRMTVVLELDGEVSYLGSSCAVKVLEGLGWNLTRGTVENEARSAQTRRDADRANAIELLEFFRPDDPGAADRYREANGGVALTWTDWQIEHRLEDLKEQAR